MSIPRSDPLRVPQDAATPFHASAYGANIVLRTMDSVDFHVSTAIMASHSVFFEHLFSDASDSSEDSLNNGRPVIPLQDGSQDIRALLLLFYPGVLPEARNFESTDDAFHVYGVAEKYCMHQCVFEAFEHAVLSSDAFSVHDPIAEYCLGVRAGSKALLRDAAYKCLDFTLSSLLRNLGLYSHLGFLKQSHVMTLWAYHEECGTKAAGILHPRSIHYSSWLDPSRNIQHPWVRRNPYRLSTSNTIAFMSCQFLSEIHYMHDWVHDYLRALIPLLRARPSPKTIEDGADLLRRVAKGRLSCSICKGENTSCTTKLVELLCQEVKRAVNEVILDVRFSSSNSS